MIRTAELIDYISWGEIMECPWCGKEFTKTKSFKGYCCEDHYQKDWFDRPRGSRLPVGWESPDKVQSSQSDRGLHDNMTEN